MTRFEGRGIFGQTKEFLLSLIGAILLENMLYWRTTYFLKGLFRMQVSSHYMIQMKNCSMWKGKPKETIESFIGSRSINIFTDQILFFFLDGIPYHCCRKNQNSHKERRSQYNILECKLKKVIFLEMNCLYQGFSKFARKDLWSEIQQN